MNISEEEFKTETNDELMFKFKRWSEVKSTFYRSKRSIEGCWDNSLLILYATDEGDYYKPMLLGGDDLRSLMAFLNEASPGDVPVIQDQPLVIFINNLGYEFDCVLAIWKEE